MGRFFVAGTDGKRAAIGAVDFVFALPFARLSIGPDDAVAAVGTGSGDRGTEGLIIEWQIPGGLQDLASSEETSMFEPDILHQRKCLFDDGFVIPPPFGPGGDGVGKRNGFTEIGKALIAESFRVGLHTGSGRG